MREYLIAHGHQITVDGTWLEVGLRWTAQLNVSLCIE